MSFLYRHALFITRKQPYLDWAGSDGDVSLPDELSLALRTVYLVPEVDGEPKLEELIEDCWERIFEEELSSWSRAEERWPRDRTRALFDAWFGVELNATVYDLAPEEPLTQADVDAQDLLEASTLCAGCGADVEEGEGRYTGFKTADRSRFRLFEGRVLPLPVDGKGYVLCVVTAADSDSAREGDDLLVRVCSSGCEKAVRAVVPKAMRRWARVTGPEDDQAGL